MKRILFLMTLVVFTEMLFSCKRDAPKNEWTAYVNPIIGTDLHGHTFPGPVLPFGMIQLGPDTGSDGWEYCSGYHYADKSILGFSHTHLSGPGAGGGLDILFMPTVGDIKLNPGDTDNTETGYRSKFSHIKEVASPGYYSVFLEDYKIEAKLTSTTRVGLHKYTFPASEKANIIIDLEHGFEDFPDSLFLDVKSNEISGYRTASPAADGHNLDMNNTIYFVAKFSKPFTNYGIAIDNEIQKGLTSGKGKNVKGYFRFTTEEKESVLMKVAISSVSIEGARKNMDAELPGWDFEEIRSTAKEAWNKELGKIEIQGGTKEQQKVFYTALYHSAIHPNIYMDVDRKYRSTNGNIYTATDFDNYTNFSLWDQFRGQLPLHTILNQEKTNQFIRTFIERYENSQSLPMMEWFGHEESSMIGYHSLPVIADAYAKNIRDYDVPKAYEAMKQLADNSRKQLKYYKKYGFIPYDLSGKDAVSRTLEYSFDDWCVTRLAKDFNDEENLYYNQRGKFYKNLFSKKIGFMKPKNSEYKWLDKFDPMEQSGYFTEANSYQYTTFAPQDIEGMIELMGGEVVFEKWLDTFFTKEIDATKINVVDMTGIIGQYAHGNEPSHHIPYLYNYVGASWKTQKLTRQILTTLYTDKPDGLIGNDDLGQLSAWYVLSAMGFYSVTPGMDYYVIGSPLFDSVTLNLENGNSFKIVANNNNKENVYIQSVKLNGEIYSKSYLKHQDIMQGGQLVFEMGNKPNKKWGTKKENRPYSEKYEFAPTPKISFKDRTFIESSIITLLSEKNATIRYTLDGSEPNENSKRYKQPFEVKKSCVLKAKCFVKGVKPGYPIMAVFNKVDIFSTKPITGLKPGLNYIYKEGALKGMADLDKYPILKSGIIETINIDAIKDERPFGYHYKGFIKIPKDGLYTFYLESNDGAVFYIDNKMIIDNGKPHRAQESFGKVGLQKGFHAIKLDYFQMGNAKSLILKWEGPGIKKQEIPTEVLFH